MFGGGAVHLSETEGGERSPEASKPRVQSERKQGERRIRKETNEVVFEHQIRHKHRYGS